MKRVLHWLLGVSAAAIAVGAVALASAAAYLTSHAGNERVAKAALEQVNASIDGSVTAKEMQLGLGHVVLLGLTLNDPEGHLAARVDKVELRFSPAELIRKRLHVVSAHVDRPQIVLTQDERGLNFLRALHTRSRGGGESGAQGGLPNEELIVDALSVERGEVRFHSQDGSARVTQLGLTGAGTFSLPTQRWTAHAALSARAQEPLEAPLELRLEATGEGLQPEASVQLRLGGSEVRGRLRVDGTARANVELDSLVATPEVVRAFAPSDPLELPLTAQGTLSLEGGRATVAFDAKAGAAKAHLAATGNLAARFAEHASLAAQAPGLSLTVSGRGDAERMDITGDVWATSLAAFSRALGLALATPAFPLGGRGELRVVARGPTLRPSVHVRGALEWLRFGEASLRGIRLSLDVPSLHRPLQSQATLRIRTVGVGARRLGEVDAELSTHGRALAAQVSAGGGADLKAHLGGTIDADGQGLSLEALAIHFPLAEWALEAPSHVRLEPQLRVSPLRLRFGEQLLDLDAERKGRALTADLELHHLQLATLSSQLTPTPEPLSGEVNAAIHVSGAAARPTVSGRVTLSEGQFRKAFGVTASLEARYADGRATGRLEASGAGALVETKFDISPEAVRDGRPEPLSIHAAVSVAHMEQLLRAVDVIQPWHGAGTATLDVSGRSDEPVLSLDLEGKDVHHGTWPLFSVAAHVATAPGGKLTARVSADGLGGRAIAAVRSELTLARAIRERAAARRWLRTPLEWDADVEGVRVEAFAPPGTLPQGVAATVGLHARMQGSAAQPRGTVQLALVAGAGGKPPLVEAATESELESLQTRTALRVRGSLAQLEAAAALDAPAEMLLRAAAVSTAPLALTVHGELPLRLVERFAPSSREPGGEERALTGTVRFEGTGNGSLVHPVASLHATSSDLSLGDVPLGEMDVAATAANGRVGAKLTATSAYGGSLVATGDASLELGWRPRDTYIPWRTTPFAATLQSRGFELDTASPFVPQIHELGGSLDANVQASGTFRAPHVRGELEWRDGKLRTGGLADLKAVHLRVTVDDDGFELKDASARSEDGSAHLSAVGRRRQGLYELEGQVGLSRFPILVDDQLFATLTTDARFEGAVSRERIDVRRLAVSRAYLQLPDVRLKNVQELERPSDIHLVHDGKQPPVEAAASRGPTAPNLVRAVLDAPRNLWVKGTDVNVELGLSEGFRFEYAGAPSLFGDVTVQRGRVEVLGRPFDVERGADMRFSGSPTEPKLNLTGSWMSLREDVTVRVAVQGQGTHVQIKPSSEPPLTDSEIYTLLATGRRSLKHDSGSMLTAGQAASAVGAVAASQAKKVLARKLPLKLDLSVQAGDEGLTGTQLQAGTYVSDRTYVGYAGRIGADPTKGENSNAGHVEYQVSKRWSLQAEYGDAKAGSADIIWSREY